MRRSAYTPEETGFAGGEEESEEGESEGEEKGKEGEDVPVLRIVRPDLSKGRPCGGLDAGEA